MADFLPHGGLVVLCAVEPLSMSEVCMMRLCERDEKGHVVPRGGVSGNGGAGGRGCQPHTLLGGSVCKQRCLPAAFLVAAS